MKHSDVRRQVRALMCVIRPHTGGTVEREGCLAATDGEITVITSLWDLPALSHEQLAQLEVGLSAQPDALWTPAEADRWNAVFVKQTRPRVSHRFGARRAATCIPICAADLRPIQKMRGLLMLEMHEQHLKIVENTQWGSKCCVRWSNGCRLSPIESGIVVFASAKPLAALSLCLRAPKRMGLSGTGVEMCDDNVWVHIRRERENR